MHVAFVATPDLGYVSGSSLALTYTADALAAGGVRSTVLCQRAPRDHVPAPGVEYVELPLPLDYQVITDRPVRDDDIAACVSLLVGALVRLHAERPVDVVHAVYGTFTGLAAATAAALLDVPYVVTTYGRDLEVGRHADPRLARMMELVYPRAAAVVAADSAVAADVAASYGVPPERIAVVPPPVHLELMRGAERQPRGAGGRVLAIQSSFGPAKGLAVLVEALGLAGRDDVVLDVVGHDDVPGEPNHRRLVELAASLGIAGRVRFAGHLPHRRVPGALAAADVYADPRLVNSYSSCVYEALAAGVPVVASDVACNRRALGEGRYGVLVRPGDPAALAEALATVLDGRAGIVPPPESVFAGVGLRDVADRQRAIYERLRG